MSARHLLSNAQNGNFEAAVQVFINYRDGALDFEKNEESAQLAFENIIDILSSDFYLNELNISNFKKILDLKIILHKNLTVFIGENGAGKTTLLRGIQKNLSWFSAFILKENTNGERIVDSEINNKAKKSGDVARLNCSFRIGKDYRIDGQLIREPKGITTDLKSVHTNYRKFGQDIRQLIVSKKEVNLPIFVSYDIDRLESNDNRKSQNHQENIFYQLDGYDSSSKSKVTFENLIDWLVKILKVATSDIDTPEKLKIISQINTLIEVGADNKNSPLNELYKDLLSLLRLYPEDEVKKKAEIVVGEIEKIFINIYPDLKKIQLINDDDGEDKIALSFEHEMIFLHQFSDGQRVLFGLIGDIARRLILLNPIKSEPLKGSGIVLIDEIELHLHPSWQQKIILILRESFPNIQFIMTTHSPHVITTVEHECIRSIYIDSETNTFEYEIPQFTKGAESNVVLEDVFYVDPRPQDVEEVKLLEEYISLVNLDQWDSERAIELRQKLDAWGRNKETELDRIDVEISLRKFKRMKK